LNKKRFFPVHDQLKKEDAYNKSLAYLLKILDDIEGSKKSGIKPSSTSASSQASNEGYSSKTS